VCGLIKNVSDIVVGEGSKCNCASVGGEEEVGTLKMRSSLGGGKLRERCNGLGTTI
jgi:hypothetical protein